MPTTPIFVVEQNKAAESFASKCDAKLEHTNHPNANPINSTLLQDPANFSWVCCESLTISSRHACFLEESGERYTFAHNPMHNLVKCNQPLEHVLPNTQSASACQAIAIDHTAREKYQKLPHRLYFRLHCFGIPGFTAGSSPRHNILYKPI